MKIIPYENPEYIWEKQPYESDTDYAIFCIFLEQAPENRSLYQAYRDYCMLRHQNLNKVREEPIGRIKNIAVGKDLNGEKVEGAKTWKERAAAYDSFKTAEEKHLIQQKARSIMSAEQIIYDDLLVTWETIYNKYKDKISGTKFKLTREELLIFEKIVNIRSQLSDDQRTSLGLNDKNSFTLDDGEQTIRVEWVD